MKSYAIGVDIGGTKISAVLGTPSGKILARREIKTQTGKAALRCIPELLKTIRDLTAGTGILKKQICGIGVCLPGAVDTRKGIVPVSPHLEGWQGIGLGKILGKAFGVPVRLANDANAAAVAEKVFGQGKGLKNFIYMTISTGIGGGLVADGKLLEGESFVAGEVGHMTIEPHGEKWKLGEVGVLEAYASGTAIARYVEKNIRGKSQACRKRYLDSAGKISGRGIGAAAKRGDPLALKAYERAGFYLGIGIGNLLNILNPGKVILGGGVLKSAPPVFWRAFRKSCRQRSWPQAYRAVRIVRTKLGDEVGNLGALALVFEN